MEARLKAILEMESSQMQKELVAASNNLKKFERELAKATDVNHITYLQRSIGVLNADINRLTAAANGSAKAMGAVGNAMKSSQMNSQNFARVIQDLPFGFMGIQNNLTQLIPGIGAAGLAFSALTAAITFSQVGLSYWSKGGEKAAATLSTLQEYTKKYTDEVGNETAKLSSLFSVATNANIPLERRKDAVKEIRDLYGNYLKGFSDEEILAGKATKAYNNLADAIIRKAKANAAQDAIGGLVAKQLETEIKMAEIAANAQEMAAKAQPQNISAGPGMPVIRTTKEQAQAGIFAEASRNVKKLADEYENLQKQINNYLNIINNNQAAPLQIDKPTKTAAAPAVKDTELSRMITVNNEFQQKKGKWWRETQTFRGNNLGMQDTTKVRIEENSTLNKILAEQADVQAMLNEQLAGAAQIAEYGGQVFGQMVAAMMNGESIGDVLANAFKQIAIQIAAAVAQALIFAALLEAFPALKGVFGTVGAVSGNMGQSNGIGNLIGQIQGQNIQLSMSRTSTGMGYRRGRR